MKLLGAPKFSSATGQSAPTAVVNLIQEWNPTEHIEFMHFDTTASNTGVNAGTCVLLEKTWAGISPA